MAKKRMVWAFLSLCGLSLIVSLTYNYINSYKWECEDHVSVEQGGSQIGIRCFAIKKDDQGRKWQPKRGTSFPLAEVTAPYIKKQLSKEDINALIKKYEGVALGPLDEEQARETSRKLK